MKAPQQLKGALSLYLANKRKEMQEKQNEWAKNVLVHEENLKTKVKCVSARAGRELITTGSYLEEEKNDNVSAAQASLANINKTCDQRVEELK